MKKKKFELNVEDSLILSFLDWLGEKSWSKVVIPTVEMMLVMFFVSAILGLVIGSGMILGFWDLQSLAHFVSGLR